MNGMTWGELLIEYGHPLYTFTPKGDWDAEERVIYSIPREVAVFKLIDRPDCIVCANYYGSSDWFVNAGERWAIIGLMFGTGQIPSATSTRTQN